MIDKLKKDMGKKAAAGRGEKGDREGPAVKEFKASKKAPAFEVFEGSKKDPASRALLLADLDGSLLNTQKKLSSADRAAIENWLAAGNAFSIVSGRIPALIEDLADLPDDGYGAVIPAVASNGAYVGYLHNTHKKHCPSIERDFAAAIELPRKPAIEFCARLQKAGLNYGVFYGNTVYYLYEAAFLNNFKLFNSYVDERLKVPLLPLTGGTAEIADENFAADKGCCLKLLAVAEDKAGEEKIAAMLADYRSVFSYAFSRPGVCDVMHKSADKGRGLATLARALQIGRENIYVFGDYNNDLPMFAEAGFRGAPANAVPDVKKEADYLCRFDNDHAAFAEYVGLIMQKFYNAGQAE